MGYCFEPATEGDYHEGRSYPSSELLLKWRIEDLRSRLEDISTGNYGISAHYFMGCRFSRDELECTPPEYFSRESNITDALAIAEENLAATEAEEADLREIEKSKTNTEEYPTQLTIWDILHVELSAPSIYEQKQAA